MSGAHSESPEARERRRQYHAARYRRLKDAGLWRAPSKEAKRREMLKARYGITPEGYEALLARQGGHCALCPRQPGDRALHVDHDHETGEVRGLLCGPCNGALGFVERAGWLVAALAYLGR